MTDKGREPEEDTQPGMSPLKRWVRRILIVVLVLAALFVAGLIVATKIADHDAIKLGLQDYIAELTNSEVTVGNFERVAFYPSLDLRLQNVILRPHDKGGLFVEIGDLKFRMAFWDIFMGRPRASVFEIDRGFAQGGLITEHPLYIQSLRISDDGFKGGPGLAAEGTYGTAPFSLAVEFLKVKPASGLSYYTYPPESNFTFNAPFAEMAGRFVRAAHGGMEARFDKIVLPGAPVLKGTADFVIQDENFRWHADLHTENSQFEIELVFGDKGAKGEAIFTKLAVEDLALFPAVTELVRLFVPEAEGFKLPDQNLTLEVEVAGLSLRDNVIGRIAFPLTLIDHTLKAGPVTGGLLDGEIEGQLLVKEENDEISYDLLFALEEADFGRLGALLYDQILDPQTASLTLGLSASAPVGEPLPLEGAAILVTDQGRVETPFAAIWESDIVPVLERPEETRLKCFFAETVIFIPDSASHPCHKIGEEKLEGDKLESAEPEEGE